ncbi:MAG: hypothetical protein Q9195_007329 [Heterodermia aff. obscurata]
MPRVRRRNEKTENETIPSASRARRPSKPQRRPPSPYGALGLLPLEIRNGIYALVFVAGHTALRCTSKTLHAHTEGALYRHGVYRLDIDEKYRQLETTLPYQQNLENVQNVRIHIVPPSPYGQPYGAKYRHANALHNIVCDLVNSIQKQRTCCVKFTLDMFTQHRKKQALEAIMLLDGFEGIDVEIHSNVWTFRKDRSSLLYSHDEMTEGVRSRLVSESGSGNMLGVRVDRVTRKARPVQS